MSRPKTLVFCVEVELRVFSVSRIISSCCRMSSTSAASFSSSSMVAVSVVVASASEVEVEGSAASSDMLEKVPRGEEVRESGEVALEPRFKPLKVGSSKEGRWRDGMLIEGK